LWQAAEEIFSLRETLLCWGLSTAQSTDTVPDMTEHATLAPTPGLYRHYKGGLYEVIGTARHSETEESLVVYRPLYDDSGLWVRPLAMFMEKIQVNGQLVARFERQP